MKLKYIKLFQSHSDYNTYITSNDKILPNLSYCVNENEVHFNHLNWAEEYLTFVAREDGTISFDILQSMGTDMITSISYSMDNGETWTTTANQDNKSENLVIDVNVNTGDKVLWKGIANQLGFHDEDLLQSDYYGSFFSSDCEFDAKGNVMSLLYGDNFKGQITIREQCAFCFLFHDKDKDGEKTCGIVNAKDLSLPATTLTEGCYYYMFQNCTSLITAPELPATTLVDFCYSGMFYGCTSLINALELPATTLAQGCYYSMFSGCTALVTVPELSATTLADFCYEGMFQGCTSLVTAPELPATILTSQCYENMFKGCTSLTTAPELPATTLAIFCYSFMFNGCISLTTAPELPATTLANYCYNSMFFNCTSLITAPELPATTLTNQCYDGMFNGCTSLVTAPELPATTLTNACYEYMFRNCTSLTTAPELHATTLTSFCYESMFSGCTSLTTAPVLPAITLANDCYRYMFLGCTSLNYIKAMFTTTPSDTYTKNWVQNVSATGTFVKNSAAQWNVTGNNGIPSGWTVQTASE